jgi:hypothetical protein
MKTRSRRAKQKYKQEYNVELVGKEEEEEQRSDSDVEDSDVEDGEVEDGEVEDSEVEDGEGIEERERDVEQWRRWMEDRVEKALFEAQSFRGAMMLGTALSFFIATAALAVSMTS